MPRFPRPFRRYHRLAAVLALAAAPLAAGESVRLPDAALPRAQEILLDLDPARDAYSGSVAIELEVVRPTSEVVLHARGERVTRLALSVGGAMVGTTFRLEAETERLLVSTAAPLAPGPHRLEIDFEQSYNQRSVALYKTIAGGEPYLFTQFQAIDAREAFPCWDEPGRKIPYRLAVTIPEGLEAVSNMPVESQRSDAGRRHVEFAATPPTPAYLLALAVGPFDAVAAPGGSIPIRILAPRGQTGRAAFAAREAPLLLAALERWFERPYPYPKLDLLAVPEYTYGAMENPGAITFRDEILLVDEATASAAWRLLAVRVLAHELAHMWFGDLVTMAWWDDFWLNESFADWMADKITAVVHPELTQDSDNLRTLALTMAYDAQPTAPPIRLASDVAPEHAFQNVELAYHKGKAAFEMVEAWIGEEPFRRGVIDYLGEHAWGNARAADLWRALDASSGSDPSGVLRSFIEQPGLPLVDLQPLGGGRVRLTQRRFALEGAAVAPLLWRVPVRIRYADARGVHVETVLLERQETSVELPHEGEVAWWMPHADARGYYRWRLPAPALAALVRDARGALTARERAALLSNLEALFSAGELDGGGYVALLAELEREDDPDVLAMLVGRVTALRQPFVSSAVETAYAEFVRGLFLPAAERLGWRSRPGESEATKQLRPLLLEVVGREGRHEPTRAEARRIAESYLADPAAIDGGLADVALRLTALSGGPALHEDLRRRYEATDDPQLRAHLLEALGAFPDPGLAEETLAFAFSPAVGPPERLLLMRDLAATGDAVHELVFDWTVEHWESVRGGLPPFMVAFLAALAGGCSLERLSAAESFFAAPEHQAPGLAAILSRVGDEVRSCARLREREGAGIARALAASRAGR